MSTLKATLVCVDKNIVLIYASIVMQMIRYNLLLDLRPLRFNLLHTLNRRNPRRTILYENLPLWSEPGLVQIKIIDGADTQYTLPRKRLSDTIHERAARRAEIIRHHLARGNSVRLTIGAQLVAATNVG